MTTVWIVSPAHGRHDLTNLVLKQRRRMADELAHENIHVESVIIASDQNLDIAHTHGFRTIYRDNTQLGARFNDGIETALKHGADIIMPAGSDDWIHPDYLRNLPTPPTIRTARACTIIREDGRIAANLRITYEGGAGTRCYPRHILQAVGGRPCRERNQRGCDTSILTTIQQKLGPQTWQHTDDPDLIIAFKTRAQLNPYRDVASGFATSYDTNPLQTLRAWYPTDLVKQVARYYGITPAKAAA